MPFKIDYFSFSHYGGGHKSSASMSALTLLAFLFFLHILQQCIKDHMADMSTPPVMIMTAGREGEETISKSADFSKIDKTGITQTDFKDISENDRMDANKLNKITEKYDVKNPYDTDGLSNKNQRMSIKTAYSTNPDEQKNKHIFKNFANRSSNFAGFVSAMDED